MTAVVSLYLIIGSILTYDFHRRGIINEFVSADDPRRVQIGLLLILLSPITVAVILLHRMLNSL
jgi:hypothetical protein